MKCQIQGIGLTYTHKLLNLFFFYVNYHSHSCFTIKTPSSPHVVSHIIKSFIALSCFFCLKFYWIQQNTAVRLLNVTQYELTLIPVKVPTNWTFLQRFSLFYFCKTQLPLLLQQWTCFSFAWLNWIHGMWISLTELESILTFMVTESMLTYGSLDDKVITHHSSQSKYLAHKKPEAVRNNISNNTFHSGKRFWRSDVCLKTSNIFGKLVVHT